MVKKHSLPLNAQRKKGWREKAKHKAPQSSPLNAQRKKGWRKRTTEKELP